MRPATTRFLLEISGYAQALLIRSLAAILQRLGPVRSSNLGGWAARSIGPRLAVSRVGDDNLHRAFPGMGAVERQKIILGVWDNLGRTVAEIPHLSELQRSDKGPGWEMSGAEHIEGLLANGTQALFFSGHLGNWEMVLPIAWQYGLPVSGVYRPASNKRVNGSIQALRQRALGPQAVMFTKGAKGARAILSHLQHGGLLGLLVDQKLNDGISVPFFGRNAMTAPALAQFALRFHLPIIPVHVVRLGPARFRMVCEAPMKVPLSGDKRADIHAITSAVNATLERWIRAEPASWLWLHRRWPEAG